MAKSSADGAWLAFRAFLAVALTVGFYLFALGVAAGLLALAWHMAQSPSGFSIKMALFCVVAAGLTLWGTLPRPDRFVAPGPLLRPAEHPRLFEVLRDVARKTGEEMPASVYLVPEVNAGVLQRGGVLGFGGRRVMILGLPLLVALRVGEFRGVLAHEFGHYAGGETRLGPWIYRTHESIARTVRLLAEAESLVMFLFQWYGTAFLRITHAISRRQELAADRLAASVAGAPAVADGLRRVHGAAAAYQSYFGNEVVPVLASGFRPPLADGFGAFLRVRGIATAVDGLVRIVATEDEGSAYDSHPPLGARLRELGDPEPVPPSEGEPFASTLLEELPELEKRLLAIQFPTVRLKGAIRWEEAGPKVYLPAWRKELAENAPVLAGVTPGGLPSAFARPAGDPKWRRRKPREEPPPGENAVPPIAFLAAKAMILLLVARGWKLHCAPGKEISVQREGEAFFPFQEVLDLHAGDSSAEGWRRRCEALGVSDVVLADVVPDSAGGAPSPSGN